MASVITSLEVLTLGRFELHRNHGLLTGGNWSRRKVCDLFKLLLTVEQHRVHREQVQEILWPNSTSEQAANSFGKTLYLLRRALEPDLVAGKGSASIYVLLDHDTLILIPDSVSIDADIFETSTRQLQARMRSLSTSKEAGSLHESLLEEFDRVLALYRGDYLSEDLYEEWTQRRRDRLRRIHSWLLENAAELAQTCGKGVRASEYLLELLEGNPVDEQTHRQLMLVYARMGRRSDALNQYLTLRRVLKEELRSAPLPETNEAFRRIQLGQVPVDLRESWLEHSSIPGPVLATGGEESPSSTETNGHNQPGFPMSDTASVDTSSPGEEERAGRENQSLLDPERILKAELVGREEEIVRMQRAFTQAREGQRRVVFISGEPGIGKSRLAREFTRWGEGTQQATVLWGYCYEMSGLLPYQPIADAINAHARVCSPEKLRSMLGSSAVDLAKIAPEIREKLPDLPQPEPLGPEAERRNLYSAVARFFNVLAAESPFILILDDLQWADAATVHLLNYLTLQSGQASPFDSPLPGDKGGGAMPLYLLLYRADEVYERHPLRSLIASLMRAGIGTELRLYRLNEEQVQQLLINMARQDVTPTFVGEIYRHTEGNPFFIGEAVRSLILEGKIKWTGERWQSTVKVTELEIPQSVRLLIERRLVSLSPDCRSTLATAAVLGREFSSALLCEAHHLSEEDVAEHIDNAIQVQILASLYDVGRRDLLNRRHGRDLDLAFTHDMIREVLYQSLNPLRRRTVHRQVGQAIEKRYAARLEPYYGQLAYHYQMAEDYTKAVDYFLKAADQASRVYAFVDAGSYMHTALDLLLGDSERPRRATLLKRLAHTYLYTGQLDEAIKAGLASCALWRDLDEPVKQADTYLEVAFICHWQGREQEAVKYIQDALACIEDRPEEVALLAKAYAQWGLAATVIGETPEALAKLRQMDMLHAKIDGNDPFILVVSLWARAWCAFLAGTSREMLAYALQGAEVCRSTHNPDWEPMMNYSAAWAYMELGQLAEGERVAQDALQKARQHGVVGAQGWAYLVQAFLAIQEGRWEDARRLGDHAHAIATMLHDADLRARVLWSRSVCAGWQGNWAQAVSDALEALHIARQEGETSMVYPHLLVQAAKAYFHAGKPEEAQQYLDQGLELARQREYRRLPAIGQRLQGRIWQALGRLAEAQPCFERSLCELQVLEDQIEYARTQEAYGLFYLARDAEGDMGSGQELIRAAQVAFERLGVNG